MISHPWLWLIAGPNGAGKSTLAAERFADLLNINADVEAARLSPMQPGQVAVAAGKRTIVALRAALDAGTSFTLETTLAGRMHFRVVRRSQARGWHVGLAFIGIDDADDALGRVQERYRRGGHNVPPGDVRRRYRRSMANLPLALRLADAAIVYDNSSARGFWRLLELRQGLVSYLAPGPPVWFRRSLNDLRLELGERLEKS